VDANAKVALDLTLELGSQSEIITVTAATTASRSRTCLSSA
jgi:hypothetical protein